MGQSHVEAIAIQFKWAAYDTPVAADFLAQDIQSWRWASANGPVDFLLISSYLFFSINGLRGHKPIAAELVSINYQRSELNPSVDFRGRINNPARKMWRLGWPVLENRPLKIVNQQFDFDPMVPSLKMADGTECRTLALPTRNQDSGAAQLSHGNFWLGCLCRSFPGLANFMALGRIGAETRDMFAWAWWWLKCMTAT